jgi:hypothetical protein
MTPRPLFVRGMHGLGDNLHQRAVIRQLIAAGHASGSRRLGRAFIMTWSAMP